MMMRIQRLTLAGVATLLCVLALNATPAGAEVGYANLCPSLKTAFCVVRAGELRSGSVAVDNSKGPSAGDVWVLGGGNALRLVKFDASGAQLGEINNGSIPGSARPFGLGSHVAAGVAVDPTSGDVYVSEYGETEGENFGTVTRFDASGVFQFQLTGSETPQGLFDPTGLAVDPSSGDLYVGDSRGKGGGGSKKIEMVDKFTPSGKFIGQFRVPLNLDPERFPYQVYGAMAMDLKGDLYITFASNGELNGVRSEVREYSSTGAPVNCPDGENLLYESPSGPESLSPMVPIAVDPSDEHIFIGEVDRLEGGFIAEYSAPCAAPQARIGLGEGSGSSGFGVIGSTHTVYASNGIFGQVTLPDVATGTSPTGVTRTSATVNGTVNPDATSVTTCEFQYGTTAAYGHTVPCSQPLPLEGNSPKPVSAEITGLSLPPASAVHYRLKVGNANGDDVGEDETLYTEPLPAPVVGGLPASGVTQFDATLNGTLKTGEGLVNFHFEYGTSTAYGLLAPIPDSYTPITRETLAVSQPVGGLQAGTTYHYRLVASSPGATNVAGPDETFTTLPIPAPTVETGAASGVGVSAATLSGAIDPHGWDTTYLFQYGTSTAYGSSWPTVQVEMGALEGPQPVVVNVPNLLPGTAYHYRLIATDGGGTTYGPDMTFTTGAYPAQVIQEPVALRTLLVPSGEGVGPSSKHGKKSKQSKRHAKRKRKVRGKQKKH